MQTLPNMINHTQLTVLHFAKFMGHEEHPMFGTDSDETTQLYYIY